MRQSPKMLGPNNQNHPLDSGSFLPYPLIVQTKKSPMPKKTGKNLLGGYWTNE